MSTPRQLLILLRGINVGGRNKVPMADLRGVAEALGHTDVRTYIASGNLMLRSNRPPAEVVDELQAAVAERLGVDVPFVVRTDAEWAAFAEAPAFADAAESRPKFLHLGVGARPAAPGAEDALTQWCRDGERVRVDGDVVWLDYANGAGRSKISAARIDRAFGCPVTSRNFRTVTKLRDLMAE